MQMNKFFQRKNIGDRIWEIDFFRGVCITLMVFDHLFFNLLEFYDIHIPFVSGTFEGYGFAYFLLKTFFAGCFVFLSGISCTFSRSNFLRGIRLLFVAFGLTLVTYLFMPEEYILFGILHFLAVSMILAPLFMRLSQKTLIPVAIAAAILIFGFAPLVTHATTPFPALAILGFQNRAFSSADYFPLFPWLGIFILGILFGRIFYKEKRSLFHFHFKPNIFNYIGRYTLWVYLIHQPVLFGVLWVIFGY